MATIEHRTPATPTGDSTSMRETFERAIVGGEAGARPVVLLHGFPEDARSWDRVGDDLVAAGFRTVAFHQLGFGPSPRPRRVSAYRMTELVSDVIGMADEMGLDRFDLVGHDWGGAVAWAMAHRHPDRLRRMVVLSTPHPRALATSLLTSDQALRSAYAAFFQVPALPELVLRPAHAGALRLALVRSGLDDARAEQCAEEMSRPGALRAALNWYRAAARHPFTAPGRIAVPTLYVWSTGDAALGYDAARRTGDWVDAAYRFDVLDGVSHWIHHDVPEVVAERVASWILA